MAEAVACGGAGGAAMSDSAARGGRAAALAGRVPGFPGLARSAGTCPRRWGIRDNVVLAEIVLQRFLRTERLDAGVPGGSAPSRKFGILVC